MFKEKKVQTMNICRQHHDKMARTKTNTQNRTKHAEQQDITDIQNKLFVYFDRFSRL